MMALSSAASASLFLMLLITYVTQSFSACFEETPFCAEPYTKNIICDTKRGENGTKTLECDDTDDIMTSCGIWSDLSETPIFNKGAYIERTFVNEIMTTDGICHIDYNITSDESIDIGPAARCCNFMEAYGKNFRCRYFKSSEEGFIGKNQDSSPTTGAKNLNEYTFVTCNAEFPLLLGCSTKMMPEDGATDIMSDVDDIDDIQFYGSFYAPPSNENKTAYDVEDNFNLEQTSRCYSQHGPNEGNYKIVSIATCCTYNVNETWHEPTEQPTLAPTYPILEVTPYYGSNGTNPGSFFEENGYNGPIIGISEWGIMQIIDEYSTKLQYDNTTIVAYQGILIGEYQILNTANNTIETITSDSDYYKHMDIYSAFSAINLCESFVLNVSEDGTRDYIIGYDIYYTKFAIYGITFYTAFDETHSCPTNEIFIDTSINETNKIGNDDTKQEYIMHNTSHGHISESYEYDIYKLSGFRGFRQTRILTGGITRSVMASISFLFLRDNDNDDERTEDTEKSTTNTSNVKYNSCGPLNCYTISGEKRIKCENSLNDTIMSCTGYCESAQIFNTFIDDTNNECIVNTINENDNNITNITAIAICCRFKENAERNYWRFYYLAIIGGSALIIIIIFIFIYLFFIVRRNKYFNPEDIDDDIEIDKKFGIASIT